MIRRKIYINYWNYLIKRRVWWVVNFSGANLAAQVKRRVGTRLHRSNCQAVGEYRGAEHEQIPAQGVKKLPLNLGYRDYFGFESSPCFSPVPGPDGFVL